MLFEHELLATRAKELRKLSVFGIKNHRSAAVPPPPGSAICYVNSPDFFLVFPNLFYMYDVYFLALIIICHYEFVCLIVR